jgi:hypothetical protein
MSAYVHIVTSVRCRYFPEMGWYVVIKTVKGRQYRYVQRTWRENGRVRTENKYLGPIHGALRTRRGSARHPASPSLEQPFDYDRLLANVERHTKKMEEFQRECFGETAEERSNRERQELLVDLHERYGLRLNGASPVPTAAPQAEAPVVAPEAVSSENTGVDAPLAS